MPRSLFRSIGRGIKSFAKKTLPSIGRQLRKRGKRFITNVGKRGFKALKDTGRSALKDIVSGRFDKLSDIPGKLFKQGKDIVIEEGIREGKSAVEDTKKAALGKLPEILRDPAKSIGREAKRIGLASIQRRFPKKSARWHAALHKRVNKGKPVTINRGAPLKLAVQPDTPFAGGGPVRNVLK